MRNPSGTRKKIPSQSIPGANSRYGVEPRCRWKKPKPISWSSGRDQVLPGRLVLLVVERIRVDRVRAVEVLLRREDQRVVRDRRVLLQESLLGPEDRADVVDVVLDLRGDLGV